MKMILRFFKFLFNREYRMYIYIKYMSTDNTFSKFARKKINRHGNDISLKAKIGKNVFFPHPVGIVIGKNSCIGNSCWIYQNVTIGQKDGRYPNLKDNVIVFPNSIIFGDVTIGENSIIGAGSVVSQSCPPNSVLAGNPAKIIGLRKNKEYF